MHTANYKALPEKLKKAHINGKTFGFMSRKTAYGLDDHTAPNNLKIQGNPYKNPNSTFSIFAEMGGNKSRNSYGVSKDPLIAKAILRKNKAEGITHPDAKI